MTVIYQLIHAVPDPFSGDRFTLGAWVRTPPLQTCDIQTRVLVTGKPPPVECFDSPATARVVKLLHHRLQSVRPAWDSLRAISVALHFGEEVTLDLDWGDAVRWVEALLPRKAPQEAPSERPNEAGQPYWADAVADLVDPTAWVFEFESADQWTAVSRCGQFYWNVDTFTVAVEYARPRRSFAELDAIAEDVQLEVATEEAVSIRMRRLVAAAEAYNAVEARNGK